MRFLKYNGTKTNICDDYKTLPEFFNGKPIRVIFIMSIDAIKKAVRDIPDFPSPGIIFKDITPILSDHKLFSEAIDLMAEKYKDNPPTKIVGIEARGFIFGVALADKLGIGFVPIRKKGKLPYKTLEASYDLEYGSATVEIHEDALNSNDKVAIIDDLLATGGTAAASAELVKKLGAEIMGIDFLIELAFLKGIDQLKDYKVDSIITY